MKPFFKFGVIDAAVTLSAMLLVASVTYADSVNIGENNEVAFEGIGIGTNMVVGLQPIESTNPYFEDNKYSQGIGYNSTVIYGGNLFGRESSTARGNVFGNYSTGGGETLLFGDYLDGRNGSILIGNDSYGNNGNCLGDHCYAVLGDAIGDYSKVTEQNVVSFGNSDIDLQRRLTNVAEGVHATDAVNKGQMEDYVASKIVNEDGVVTFSDGEPIYDTAAYESDLEDWQSQAPQEENFYSEEPERLDFAEPRPDYLDYIDPETGEVDQAALDADFFDWIRNGVDEEAYQSAYDSWFENEYTPGLEQFNNARISYLEANPAPNQFDDVYITGDGLSRLANISDPIESTDAANKRYVDENDQRVLSDAQEYSDEGDRQVLASANSYTDASVSRVNTANTAYTDKKFQESISYTNQRFDELDSRIDELESEYSSAIAEVAAMPMLPAMVKGDYTIALGTGYYNNKAAVGMTFGHQFDHRSQVYGGVSASTGAKPVLRAGVSFTFR